MSSAVACIGSQARLTVPVPRAAALPVRCAARASSKQRRDLHGSPTRRAHKARAPRRRGPRPTRASADFAAQGAAPERYRPLEDEVLDEDVEETWAERGNRYFHVSVGAASLLLLNEAITRLFAARAISFSPPLAGMLLCITALCVAKACGESASNAVDHLMDFYEPLRNWVARWMPIFFVPSLIVLPRAAADIAQSEMIRMVGVTIVGWVASIAFAVALVRLIRAGVHSDITPDEEYDTSPHPVNPFSKRHYLFWGFINLLPLALAPALRTNFFLLGSMFLFASTIKGYLYGVALPRPLKRVVHPLIMCCLYSSGCIALWGYLTNMPYLDALEMYMPTGAGALGPGSLLMAMLAVVVLCDGQRVFLQRRIVRHHALEIFGTIIASALFSLFATAYLASFAGLEPMLAKSILPRAVTVALALPMTEVLGGSPSMTAALVCITGLIGAAFGQLVLTTFRVRDEISRGVAQGATSHGLGASALAANEPQALPFSAVTIAIMGSVSNLLLYVPFVRSALLAICG